MIGLTPAELADARADFDALALPETATILRRTTPGGPWSEAATDVDCRYTPGGGRRQVDTWSDVAARVDADATLRFPAGTDVRRGDRVRVTGEAGSVLCDVLHVPPRIRIHATALVRAVESI